MAYKLWLNEEMKKQFKTGTVAANVLVKYILDNIEGTKINKDLDEVTLGDIEIHGKKIKKCVYDSFLETLSIEY